MGEIDGLLLGSSVAAAVGEAEGASLLLEALASGTDGDEETSMAVPALGDAVGLLLGPNDAGSVAEAVGVPVASCVAAALGEAEGASGDAATSAGPGSSPDEESVAEGEAVACSVLLVPSLGSSGTKAVGADEALPSDTPASATSISVAGGGWVPTAGSLLAS